MPDEILEACKHLEQAVTQDDMPVWLQAEQAALELITLIKDHFQAYPLPEGN